MTSFLFSRKHIHGHQVPSKYTKIFMDQNCPWSETKFSQRIWTIWNIILVQFNLSQWNLKYLSIKKGYEKWYSPNHYHQADLPWKICLTSQDTGFFSFAAHRVPLYQCWVITNVGPVFDWPLGIYLVLHWIYI
jgi:hypothetical protein